MQEKGKNLCNSQKPDRFSEQAFEGYRAEIGPGDGPVERRAGPQPILQRIDHIYQHNMH